MLYIIHNPKSEPEGRTNVGPKWVHAYKGDGQRFRVETKSLLVLRVSTKYQELAE